MKGSLAEMDGRRLTVEAPASSANIGAGFDCLGLALDLVNTIELEVQSGRPGEVDLTVEGAGAGELVGERGNRFIRGVEAALFRAYAEAPTRTGWRVEMRNQIPLERGLGSSAAAVVAGLVAGNALAGGALTNADLLDLAMEIEGHPDNVAASLLGGFVVAASIDRRIEAIRFDTPRDLRTVLFIPEVRFRTDEMRAALPAKVPLVDAVSNLSRVALGVAGIATGRYDLLRALTVDRLHERYRARAYPQLPSLVEAARAAGAIGACLSGAGSTVIAFTDSLAVITRIEAAFTAVAADRGLPGEVRIVAPRNTGARVVSGA
jgi:homoserine kinase